jgi:hypothetical protein
MWRKVYVPTVGSYARWMNFFKNTGTSALTVTMYTSNNLGSDTATVITGSSNGNMTAETSDTWVASFQNWNTGPPLHISTDPRLAHVLQGPGASVPVSMIHFVNGDDNPWWAYTFTIAPGATTAILNYGVASMTQAAAASQAASLVSAPPVACLSAGETAEVANFALGAVPAPQHIGYCSVPGNHFPNGAAIAPGTFLQLEGGQPQVDPNYAGAVPSNYLQGIGITCSVLPGFTATGTHVGYGGAGDPGIYPYYAKTS